MLYRLNHLSSSNIAFYIKILGKYFKIKTENVLYIYLQLVIVTQYNVLLSLNL